MQNIKTPAKAIAAAFACLLSVTAAFAADTVKVQFIVVDLDNKPVQGSTVYVKIGKQQMMENIQSGQSFVVHELVFDGRGKTDKDGIAELDVPILGEDYEMSVAASRPGNMSDIVTRSFGKCIIKDNKELLEQRVGKKVSVLKEFIPTGRIFTAK